MANMRAVEQHIPVLRTLLDSDSRFGRIELSTYTGSNGSLMVRGELDSDEALEDLKESVGDSGPPAEVEYSVIVMTPEMRKRSEQFRAKGGDRERDN